METLSIGKVAEATGASVETIRFYERMGLIEKPPRKPSGYRMYSRETVTRIRFIRRAKQLGFSLKEIGELLDLRIDPETTCKDIRSRAAAKLGEIKAKIESLSRIKRALQKVTKACKGRGPISKCAILEAMESEDEEFAAH